MSEKNGQGAGLELQMDEAGTALIATVTPQAQAAPIDEAWLRARIETLGYGALRYLPTAATLLLSHYNSGRPVAALRLAECVDASLDIQISRDGMEATLDIIPPQGGAPITKNQVLAALAEKGITEGICLDAINQAIAAGKAAAVPIARGRPPIHGEDGHFESLLPEMRARVPRVKESGQVDYRDLGEIQVVHAGDPLMLRHRATTGTPGATARQGSDVRPPTHRRSPQPRQPGPAASHPNRPAGAGQGWSYR